MRAKWKIITLTGFALVVSAGYIWGIPAIVNLPKHQSEIEQKIYQASGYNVKLGKAKLSMGGFPSVWVKSNNISVLNKDGSKALSIDNPKVKLKLFPLIFKKVEIAHIFADKEVVNLVFSKDKKFLLGDTPIKFEKKETPFTISKVYLDIGEYKINLDDKSNNKKLALNGEYLNNAKFVLDDKIQLSTKGNFVVENSVTPYFADIELDLPLDRFNDDRLKIKGQLKDFDLSSISSYAPVLTNGVVQKLKGTLNFDADTKVTKYGHKLVNASLWTTGLEVIGVDKPSQIIYHNKLSLNTNIETIANGINLKNTAIESKDFKFSVNGKIASSGKKIPVLDLKVGIKPAKLQDVVKILPWFRELPPEMDFYKFKEATLWGKGEGHLHIIGNGELPEVFGKVKLRGMHLVNRHLLLPEGGMADLDFVGQIMKVNVFVPITKKESVSVKGFAKIDGSKYSELDIKSTGNVRLETAKTVLMPLHQMLKFKLGPVPVMEATGFGTINLRSAGKKVDPHLFGYLKFWKGNARFTQVHNLELINGAGEIIFDDRDVTFKTNSGTINGRPTKINGKCSVFGDMEVFAETKGQKIPDMIKVITTSPDMAEVQRVVKPFTNPNGIGDLYLTIYGKAGEDVTKIKFNEDLFAKGKVVLHNATTVLENTYMPFENVNGTVNFDKKDANYDITGYLNNSKIHVKGTAKNMSMDLVATSDRFKLINLWSAMKPDMVVPFKKELGELEVAFAGKYKGVADASKLDYDKIIVDGKILSNMNSTNPIKVGGGDFNVRHSVLNAKGLKGIFNGNPFTLSFTGTDIYKYMNIKDAVFDFNNFNIASINDMKGSLNLPQEYQKQIDNIQDIQGHINIKGTIKNGGIYSDTELKNISFRYAPLDAVINVLSGKANMRGDKLYLGRINTKVSSMPVYLNGSISNILQNPYLNLYVSGKLNQEFFDKFVNEKSVYPVKLKGDANFNSKLNGTIDSIHANSTLNVKENSSIYYMGATLSGAPSGATDIDGIATNPVSIKADTVLTPNKIKINAFDYIQTITSQNKKTSTQKQLSMSGAVSILKNNILKFDNLKIKTFEPTDAKIFNIILKKPTIKQGIFMTDMVVNGTSLAPYALGTLNISSVDIPLFDSTVRDIDINMKKDYINLNARGVILTNDITTYAKIVNKTVPPYIVEDFDVKTDVLDLNVIANTFNDYDTNKLKNRETSSNTMTVSPEQVIIKNGTISADKIRIKKAEATDFNAKVTMGDDHILHIDKYAFNLANGTVDGDIATNLSTFESNATMNIKDADAEIISENIFDMPGQMYGLVTGNLRVSCKGTNSVDCLDTLGGDGSFKVKDGRMPKLGSLEYLLKAANLVTGGITGVSVNGIIDLITPLKTGDFSQISGDIKLENGAANDINVYSEGKELNMYLTGRYNLETLVADMEVYGSLSKNFSTLLGRIGNASLNRLLNRIPGININEINPESTSKINKIPNFNKENAVRVFKSEIFGDINGTNYVKSFKWIKH